MNRTLTLILILSCIVPAVAPVVAQEETTATTTPTATATASEDNTTATATPTPTATPTASTPTATPTASTPTPDPNPPEDNSSTTVAIGPNTRVTSWTYRGDAFHLVVEADIPMRLTMSQTVNQQGTGSGTITFMNRNLAPGKNEFRVPAPAKGGEATITLSTPASREQDTAAFLHHDGNGASLLSGPYDGGDVRDSGIGASLGTAVAVLYSVARAKLGATSGGERLA